MEKEKKGVNKRTIYERFFKRFFDFVLSLLAIIVLSPVFLIVWICSKIFLGGKAIYGQYRPGKNGKVFKLYKFRSMTNATDANGNLLPDAQRNTKFGRFIRKTSLDELPQLFNILKGDMSIVGPRPRMVKDMVFYPKEVFSAYSVKPGLTGLSQVTGGRSKASWEEIFEKDLQYLKKITLFHDIKILFLTVVSLFKSDASGDGQAGSQREYWYPDYLLKTEKISKEQYNNGLNKANKIISELGSVEYDEELTNNK